ncbi:polyphosphate kinase 1 [Synechococcales cyanobacterium C]|uniref:Polyphosphate kinase n=1 Tax=Petrachloros mirabilis ULC683 TaxID=2781853 RepID=A0A8K1ZX48_9CYAN|nr:polyphosphate kinase 1 [Petrachloros mirabilis]NCJ05287.1 polyphosphate kinase 1 [Petrachloros mirabilis ULC683]
MKQGSIRIYQLAQKLDLPSRTVLECCQVLRLEVTTASSSVSAAEAEQVQQYLEAFQGTPSMVITASQPPTPDSCFAEDSLVSEPQLYFNRELSWLRFNQRVLHEAFDSRTLLLEKLKFLAIYSANLDEYFMVRVSGLKQQVAAHVTQLSLDGLTPQAQLDAIDAMLRPEVIEQHRYFEQDLRPQLTEIGIHLVDYSTLNEIQMDYLHQYFLEQIFPVLTPLAVDPGHPFPYISNLSLNLAVVVEDSHTKVPHFARVKVPSMLPRFVKLPAEVGDVKAPTHWVGVPIEQVIARNLEFLFPGMVVQASYPFRITRNADIELEEDEADDLLLAIEQELRKRRFGSVVRMEVMTGTPEFIQHTLMQEMGLVAQDVYTVDGLLCLKDLFAIAALPFPQHKEQDWTPVVPPRVRKLDPLDISTLEAGRLIDPTMAGLLDDDQADIFSVIRAGDLLVHHPYDSFAATVQQFITQAAYDPNVLTIKMTLYRTAGDSAFVDSPIVGSLIAAAENGKQVVVLVELKARFDEENNILWARKLEKVGVHVVYGLVGLKTHTKTALVVRREGKTIRRYVHLGTGNYNPKTARLYTDLGLLTCQDEIGADLTNLFNFLTGYSRHQDYRKLLVAPVNLRDRMLALIEREIEHQKSGGQGRIIAKMNSLIDKQIIMALYKASRAGVEIDLIVRGICSLKPGIPDISEHIRVISIIGRFLEHDRIFYFHNQGVPKVFIGSADWRTRNLDRRVEAVTPIEDPQLAAYLRGVLETMLQDNRQAWDLQPDGTYVQRHPQPDEPEQATHILFVKQALERSQGATR